MSTNVKENATETSGEVMVSDDKEAIRKSSFASGFSGPPKRRYRSIVLSVCSFIIVTEFCERLAFYGLTGSLPVFFKKNLAFSSALATELNALFSSVNYITPLLGAYVADVSLGRYKTILRFCVLYVAGMAPVS